MPDRHTRTLVITAAYTGMRFGELAGLTRAHVHLDRALIHVAADTGALHEVGGARWLGPPKTKAAVRDITLPPFLIDALDRLLRAHPFDTVFCTTGGGWLWRTTFIARAWRPACDGCHRAGWEPIIPGFRFHDQRHTHRTWMDEDGIPEVLKAHRLGHQLPGIRGVYAHVTQPMQDSLLAALHRRWLDGGGYW
jgi:integrase